MGKQDTILFAPVSIIHRLIFVKKKPLLSAEANVHYS